MRLMRRSTRKTPRGGAATDNARHPARARRMKPSANGSSRISSIRRLAGPAVRQSRPSAPCWSSPAAGCGEVPPHQVHVVQHGDNGAALGVPVLDDRQQQRGGRGIDRGERLVQQDQAASCTMVRANSTRWNWPADRARIGRLAISTRPTRPARPARPAIAVPIGRNGPSLGAAKCDDIAAGDRERSGPDGCPAPAARCRGGYSGAVDAAGGERMQPGHGAQQRGLAGTVGADQRGQAARLEGAATGPDSDDPRAMPQLDADQA